MPILKVIYQFVKVFKPAKQEMPVPKPWTHKNKIRELQTDEYVSAEYLKGLITNSHKKADLNTIRDYLKDGDRTSNIPKPELKSLLRKVQDRMDSIDMKEILRQMRENGTLNLSHWIDYFL